MLVAVQPQPPLDVTVISPSPPVAEKELLPGDIANGQSEKFIPAVVCPVVTKIGVPVVGLQNTQLILLKSLSMNSRLFAVRAK
jgi:hypothetical protein